MPKWLWPIRTGRTLVDVWTLCHVAFWIVMGFNCRAFHLGFAPMLVPVYLGAAVWEGVERYCERRWPDIWKHPEKWWNSWIGDAIIATTIGYGLGWWLCGLQ
jgi:hypothetical protein